MKLKLELNMTKENTLSIIAIIISVIALIASIYIPYNLFEKENRPWLSVNLIREDNGLYYKVKRIDNRTLEVLIDIKYTNIGKLPAKNIKHLKSFTMLDITGTLYDGEVNIPDNIVLAPGESYATLITLQMVASPEVINEKYNKYLIDKNFSMILPFQLYYEDFHNSKKYYSKKVFDINGEMIKMMEGSEFK